MTRTPRKILSSASPAAVDHATLLAAAPGKPDRDACRRVLAQVYKVVAAVLGPRSPDVGDVTQDAFMRVHRAIPRFVFDPDKPAGPTSWINTIALRTALDHRADTATREALSPDMDRAAFEDTDVDPSPIDRAILAAALLTLLDERHRAILILAYWNGETQEEIAETLSLPIGTVKTRMRAAHQRLREHLAAQGSPGSPSPTEEDA